MADLLDEAKALKPASHRRASWFDLLSPAHKAEVLKIKQSFLKGEIQAQKRVLGAWLVKRLKLRVNRDAVARWFGESE